jgi:hypothetical protein
MATLTQRETDDNNLKPTSTEGEGLADDDKQPSIPTLTEGGAIPTLTDGEKLADDDKNQSIHTLTKAKHLGRRAMVALATVEDELTDSDELAGDEIHQSTPAINTDETEKVSKISRYMLAYYPFTVLILLISRTIHVYSAMTLIKLNLMTTKTSQNTSPTNVIIISVRIAL